MLSSFPSLTVTEFSHGCQALQRRCENHLGDTDWLCMRWHQDVLTIRKSYSFNMPGTSERKVRIDSPEAALDILENEFDADEVEHSMV